jgi:hypothetical protein
VSQEDPAALDRLLARQRAAVVAAQELLDQAGAAESALEDAGEALWRAAEALPGCRWAAAAAAQREALDRLGHVRGAWQFRALALAERQLDEDGHAWEDAPAVRARALAGRGYPAAARLLRAGAVGEARGAFHHEQEGRRADLAEERRRCLRGLFDAWAARLDRSPDGADLGRLAADVDEARAWVAAPPLAAALTAWRGLLVPDAVAQARARLATIREVVNAAAGAGADRPAEELPLAGPRPPAPGAPVAAGAPAPWGHLPPRVRQALEQHARDRPLPRYEEEYLRYLRELTRP